MESLQQETLIKLDKEIVAQAGLREFIKRAWTIIEPGKLQWNWHMDVLCEYLEAVTRGDIRNLIVCVPPGTSKSTIVSVMWPSWAWTFNPKLKWIFTSYAQNLSNKDAKKHRDIVCSDWYQKRWGNVCSITKDTVSQIQWFENAQHGSRVSSAVGVGITGRHGNYLIFDDILKSQDAFHPGNIQKANDYWFSTMQTRQANPETTCRVGIMQRLHLDDTAAQCIENGYETIILPMEYDPNISVDFKIPVKIYDDEYEVIKTLYKDPRKTEKELLFPERFSYEAVENLKKSLGPIGSAAQLNQNPIPLGGAIFKINDFQKTWNMVPTGAKWIMSVDCSFEDEKTAINPDYCVIQVWASHNSNFYFIDQIRKKMDIVDTCNAIIEMQERYPLITSTHIEKKANGAAVIRILQDKISGLHSWPPKGTPQPGKYERANAVQPLFTNVFMPPGNPVWLNEFIQELLSFPRTKNDDCVDAATQALLILHQPSRSNYLLALQKAGNEFRGMRRIRR